MTREQLARLSRASGKNEGERQPRRDLVTHLLVRDARYDRSPGEPDGVEVVKMVMALYKSAETGQVVNLPDESLETYVPVPARVGA